MKADTAERLTERALRISDDLNEMVRDIQANEPDDEFVRLRAAIGRVMWAIYYDILKPTFDEHPSIALEAGAEGGPAAAIGHGPRVPRAIQPAQPSATGSGRSPHPRRSARRRPR